MKKCVVLISVLAILVTCLAVAGCGGGSGDDGASKAAKEFFAAYQNKNADTTWELLSEDSRKQVKKADWETFLKDSETVKFSVGEVEVNGDEATAKVTGTVSGETSTETVPLVKEGGTWKVDLAGMETETEEQ